jgi:hypothetical protein
MQNSLLVWRGTKTRARDNFRFRKTVREAWVQIIAYARPIIRFSFIHVCIKLPALLWSQCVVVRCFCADVHQKHSGLLNTYKSLFSLDDSLADIKTRADLLEYLGDVSARARDLQPTSSSYFVEETGEVKLLSGDGI